MVRLVSWLTTPFSMLLHNRGALRALAPATISGIALVAACDNGNQATSDAGVADASSSSSSGGGSGSSSGSGGSSGGRSGASKDASPDAPNCTPAKAMGTLPFVVDSVFLPSGWMGDGPAYPANPDAGTPATTAAMTFEPTGYSVNAMDACSMYTGGRSSATAKGSCYRVTFSPFPKGQGYGWEGVYWQYQRDNWGDKGPGYAIPAGATKISFWARGKLGGEWVKFFAGEGDAVPCTDFAQAVSTPTPPTYLTTSWMNYTIDISNLPYDTGVIGAFGFATGDQTLPQVQAAATEAGVPEGGLPDGGVGLPCTDQNQVNGCTNSKLEFYIDDIEWQ